MVGSGLWDSNQTLVCQKHPKNEFRGPKSVRDRDMVIWRSGCPSRLKPVYGYGESKVLIFDKIFCCCHVVRLWGGHIPHLDRGWSKFQKFPGIYPQISTVYNHVPVGVLNGVLFSRKLYRDEFLLKFQPQYRVVKSESCVVTQKYSNVSRTVRSRRGQTKNWTLWRTRTNKKRQQILSFSRKTLSRRSGLLDSILAVQSRVRALYACQAPCARNASVSSRYSGLWDRFWTYFHPQSPYETLEIRILARSLTLRSSPGVGFCHEILPWMMTNGRIRSLRLESSPRVTKTPQKWVLWTKKCSRPWYGHLTIGISKSFKTGIWLWWVQNFDFRQNILLLSRGKDLGRSHSPFGPGLVEISEISRNLPTNIDSL